MGLLGCYNTILMFRLSCITQYFMIDISQQIIQLSCLWCIIKEPFCFSFCIRELILIAILPHKNAYQLQRLNYISTHSKFEILNRLQGSFIKFFFENAHQVSYKSTVNKRHLESVQGNTTIKHKVIFEISSCTGYLTNKGQSF